MQALEHRGRVLARGVVDALESLGEQFAEIAGKLAIPRGVPTLGAARVGLAPGLMTRLGGRALGLLLGDPPLEIAAHFVGNEKSRLLGPTQGLLGSRRLLGAEGGAVGLALARHGGASPADHRAQHDQAGAITLAASGFQGPSEFFDGLTIDGGRNVPALGREAGGNILAEGNIGSPVDGDLVVVVNEDQVPEPQVPRQGSRLGGNPLHHVPIAHHAIDEMLARGCLIGGRFPAKTAAGHARGQRHPHRVGEALAQGAGGHLDPGCQTVLGVAGGQSSPLPKISDFIEGERVPVKMQDPVEKHGGVPPREHESVAQGPVRIAGIEAKVVVEEFEGRGGQTHGGTGMPAIGRVHRVYGQEADRVLDGFP